MFTHDNILRADAPFRRYRSITETGINLADLEVRPGDVEEAREWRDKYVRMLATRFRMPEDRRASFGYRINCDEAISGVAECYRMKVRSKLAPLRIGINVSTANASYELNPIRTGATLALVQLCAMRGQAVSVEVAYGNGMHYHSPLTHKIASMHAGRCHVRVGIPTPTEDIIARVTSTGSTHAFGFATVMPLDVNREWRGRYRFFEFPWERKGNYEYDFVLDRIETSDIELETKRIEDRLIAIGLMGTGVAKANRYEGLPERMDKY
jgi:hypothetical protein